MAFEAIVKKQIDKLKSPATLCIDLVMSEINNVIRKCTKKVLLQILYHINGVGYYIEICALLS